LQQDAQEASESNQSKKRKDSLDGEEVMVDSLHRDADEKEGEASTSESSMVFQLDESLFQAVEELDEEFRPPMYDAVNVAQQFLDSNLVYRALVEGDPMSIQELKDSLYEMAEEGVFPREEGLLSRFSDALTIGLEGLGKGEALSEIQDYEVQQIKATVDSTLVAADAKHSEVWEENEETILAFQNLTEEGADEVQEDLANMDGDIISGEDKEKLLDPKVTAIEIKEEEVDFWEMDQEEEYSVEEEEDVENR
jgi:hypothetical protein